MTPGQEGNGLIYVGIPRERVYITSFVDNLHAVLTSLQNDGLACGYFQAESHRVDRNRDRIVKEFLGHSQEPEWLLMLDSDMEHPVDCGQRLARWGKKVVGGLYFHRNRHKDPVAFFKAEKERDEYGRMVRKWEPIRNQAYDWLIQNNVPLRDGAFSIDGNGFGLLDVDAVGTGCVLIHRSILERMEPPWFEYRDGSQSEDLEFCDRVQSELNTKVHVDMTTVSGHYSQVPLGQAQFRAIHEGRGYSLSSYTKEQAAEWFSSWLGASDDFAHSMIESQTNELAELWHNHSGDARDFYIRPDVGVNYIANLLRWNASHAFNAIRHNLIPWRRKRVLEFGGGIGTVSIQMAIQNNRVTMVEVNPKLRDFAEIRWAKTEDRLVSYAGSMSTRSETPPGARDCFDLAIAIDVFEHLEEEHLFCTLAEISLSLKKGGRLFFHNNFGQQDIYPMHFDHSKVWLAFLEGNGFFQLGDLWAVKVA